MEKNTGDLGQIKNYTEEGKKLIGNCIEEGKKLIGNCIEEPILGKSIGGSDITIGALNLLEESETEYSKNYIKNIKQIIESKDILSPIDIGVILENQIKYFESLKNYYDRDCRIRINCNLIDSLYIEFRKNGIFIEKNNKAFDELSSKSFFIKFLLTTINGYKKIESYKITEKDQEKIEQYKESLTSDIIHMLFEELFSIEQKVEIFKELYNNDIIGKNCLKDENGLTKEDLYFLFNDSKLNSKIKDGIDLFLFFIEINLFGKEIYSILKLNKFFLINNNIYENQKENA